MIIADKKRDENIAEYVIYLWQMHDLVRAARFDGEALKAFLAQSFKGESLEMEQKWLLTLAKKMKSQKLLIKGSVSEVDDILTELNFLHQTLLQVSKDKKYDELYKLAKPNLSAYLEKAAGSSRNDVEACLQALYGLLTLRLKGVEVSQETTEAIDSFSKLMAYLSKQYRDMKSGLIDFSMN